VENLNKSCPFCRPADGLMIKLRDLLSSLNFQLDQKYFLFELKKITDHKLPQLLPRRVPLQYLNKKIFLLKSFIKLVFIRLNLRTCEQYRGTFEGY
jgi:hypothetical protein